MPILIIFSFLFLFFVLAMVVQYVMKDRDSCLAGVAADGLNYQLGGAGGWIRPLNPSCDRLRTHLPRRGSINDPAHDL